MYKTINRLHFVGIGGIGMSSIAEVLVNLGYQVSGSDISRNPNVERLEARGAVVHIGHKAEHVVGAHAVIYSSAVTADNPELKAARQRRIPVVPRAEMLAELMRLKYGIAVAGTHGKTTTTSLIATLLAEAGRDPTVVNGGIVKAFGSNARLGQGEFLVTEADESDGSFLKLSPTIAVVTNMDPEHLDFYGGFEAIQAAFRDFVVKVPFYGLAVLCRDHPEVAALLPQLSDKRVVTYGLDERADYRALELRQEGGRSRFEVQFHDRVRGEQVPLGTVEMTLPGRHNVLNTLAAIAVARELEIPWAVIVRGLAGFGGVQRRFDLLLDGPELTVIDDYAHHPVEIRATLEAARESYGDGRRLVAVFQPHRYSRVKAHLEGFFQAFGQANLVLVDRIYAAGEKPLAGILFDGGQIALVAGIRHHSGVEATRLPEGEGWQRELQGLLKPGDVVVFLGAGDISRRARNFVENL